MACRRTTELLSQALDRPLTPVERVRVWFHYPLCRACRRYGRQIEVVRRLVRDLAVDADAAEPADGPPSEALPPDARARLRDALRRAVAGNGHPSV